MNTRRHVLLSSLVFVLLPIFGSILIAQGVGVGAGKSAEGQGAEGRDRGGEQASTQ